MELKDISIYWLIDKVITKKHTDSELNHIFNQAKAMHNKEVISFAKKCLDKALDTDVRTAHSKVEELYNETFGDTTGVIVFDNIHLTNTSGTNHLSHINPLTDKLTNGVNNE